MRDVNAVDESKVGIVFDVDAEVFCDDVLWMILCIPTSGMKVRIGILIHAPSTHTFKAASRLQCLIRDQTCIESRTR